MTMAAAVGAAPLAASILADWTLVRDDLARETPRVGDVAGQVAAAFTRRRGDWQRLAAPDVDGWFPGEHPAGRVRLFLAGLGEHLATVAADGAAAGMDAQLAKGWHPDVAWQRTLAGLGLDVRAMRGYVGSAMTASATGGAVVADPLRARVQRALCQQACRAADAARAAAGRIARVVVSKTAPDVAGLAVRARDTGRVLMLQRALDGKDPAGGMWEFPGGHAEPGETLGAAAAREWREEVGRRLPPVTPSGTWRHGRYVGFVADVGREADIPIGRGRGTIVNPDDPDGDAVEQLAWWDPGLLARNPAVRPELRESLPAVRRALGEVSKAGFDPSERRDADGRWTGAGAARRVKTRTRDAVDELLAAPVAGEDQTRTYAPSKYAPARTYAAPREYAPAREYAPMRTYAAQPRDYAPPKRRTVRRRLVLILGAKKTGAYRQSVTTPPPGHVGAFYIYADPMTSHAYASPYNPDVVDFDWVRQARDMVGEKGSNEAVFTLNPAQLVPEQDRVEIDGDDWDRLLDAGKPLWDDAIDRAATLVPSLDTSALSQIAEDAGYSPAEGSATSFRDEILHAARADADGDLADPSILHAYADYMVWHQPDELGDEGERFAHLLHSATGDGVDYAITPEVMEIAREAPGDDLADTRGRYVLVPHGSRYLSPFADTGVADTPGVLGLRVVALRPEDDD